MPAITSARRGAPALRIAARTRVMLASDGAAVRSSRPPAPASSPRRWPPWPPGRRRIPQAEQPVSTPLAGRAGPDSVRRIRPLDARRPLRIARSRARETVPSDFRGSVGPLRTPAGPRRDARWPLGAETNASLAAARGEDRPAGARAHAQAEPVPSGAATVV